MKGIELTIYIVCGVIWIGTIIASYRAGKRHEAKDDQKQDHLAHRFTKSLLHTKN